MFAINIEKETLKNTYYRKVLYTDKFQQLVAMSLNVGEDIPEEVHHGTQFIRIEGGNGVAIINGKQKRLSDGISLSISPGSRHYIKNTSRDKPLKLYSIYSPPEHPRGTVHRRQPK